MVPSRRAVALGVVFAASLAVTNAGSDRIDALSLTDPTPADPALTMGTLPNGLRYYVRANRRPEKRAALRLVVNAGSILEDDDQRGLGHFVEHMAFNGTRRFSKRSLTSFLSSIGSNLGPDANAATNFDETIYMLDVRTDNAALDGGLLVLRDWAQHISFEPGAIEDERDVILEEWRLRLGAGARLRDKESPVVFEGSRYADRVPIGVPEVIRAFNPSRLRQFYTDWYRPDLMAVIATGDFDAAAMRTLVESRFKDIPARPAARPRPTYTVPPQPGTRFIVVTDPESPRTTISLLTRVPTRDGSTVGGYRQIIADRLLTTMLNSRFFETVSRPDSPVLRATVTRRAFQARHSDELLVNATVRDEGIDRAFETLLVEVARIKRFGFTQTEIDRHRQNLLRAADRLGIDADNRESGARADDYTRHFLRGDVTPSLDDQAALYRRFVSGISLDELNALARESLSENNRIIEVAAPEHVRPTLPSEARLAAIVGDASLKLVSPYAEAATATTLLSPLPSPGAISGETRRDSVGITEWELTNGVRVVIKPTTVRNDEIVFRASRLGGTSLVDDEVFGKVNGAAQIVSGSGAGRYSGVELRRALSGRIAAAVPFISELEEGLAGSGSPQDLDTLFQLIYLRFAQPRKDPAAFALLKAQLASGIASQRANPDSVFRSTLARALVDDHPRRRPLDVAALDRWDLDQAFAFYKERFSNARGFTFVFVGNVSPEALRPLVEQYLAALPSSDAVSHWRDLGVRPPSGTVERRMVKGLEPKSQVAISFTGPFEYSEARRLELRTVAILLQARLSEAIRGDLGGTYSISVNQSTQPVPRATYEIRIQWSCAPQRVEALTKRVFQEIQAMKDTPLSELVMMSVRAALDREAQATAQQNSWVLAQLSLKYALGEDPTEVWDYPARLRALDATGIRAAAMRYLDTTRYVHMTLMPEVFQSGNR